MLIFLFLLGTSILCLSSTNAAKVDSLLPSLNECGVLNEDYLYNAKKITEIDEFPWIGRIGYINDASNSIDYRCLALLISKRYIVSVSQCFSRNLFKEVRHVLLGDWDTSSDEDCNETGRCAPLPVKYEFEEIALHPNYDGKPGSYDLAVVRLNRDVQFNNFIRPICLPPDNVSNDDFVAQHALYAGFQLKNKPYEKIKTFAHITPLNRCKKLYNHNFNADSHPICAIHGENYTFMSGSALMNVQVDNSEVKRFYLIGMASAGPRFPTPTAPDVFARISFGMNFIKNNIVA